MTPSSLFNPKFWQGKKVLVTGGNGFLGRCLVERLRQLNAHLFIPRQKEYNFVNYRDCEKCFEVFEPEIVIHSAAYYGGLGITLAEPGKIYFQNLTMGTNLMEVSRLAKVKKFVSVGTACSYPGHLENALKESDLWAGPLHASVAPYGGVKKMLAIQGMAYRKQYQFHSIHLIPSNLYGPYDCFEEYRAHVVGALIKKFVDAHREKTFVNVWGSGKPIREFLYVEDCADGILLASEKYDDEEPLNIGTGMGTSIRELVDTIRDVMQFQGEVKWDTSKPDGQLVKFLDITKMQSKLNWRPRYDLNAGIKKTVEWYSEHTAAEESRLLRAS